MRIIAHRALVDYYEQFPETKTVLENWYKITKSAVWKNFSELKNTFNSVDSVGNQRYVFNIKGNNYRLVAKILFIQKIVFIRFIGTHKEYDNIDCSTV
ncbi:MAG: type II toxin-antitoxin system HigB family toxin [Prevotellaceae bacterium]|jgi:mRNA interferase HigB|nr:type II toxin-antitoxin system HigB family toxin [Prevotellaceae bacterium]